jgi:hypothetical protein
VIEYEIGKDRCETEEGESETARRGKRVDGERYITQLPYINISRGRARIAAAWETGSAVVL